MCKFACIFIIIKKPILCFKQELKKEANHRLVELLTQVENMYAKAQMLHVLLSREGLYYKANDRTIEEHLSDLAQKAAQQHVW